MERTKTRKSAAALSASTDFTFVLTLGIVNLFADVTYEGASSINGPFLGTLGAGAVAIGVISGVGEFPGYAFRIVGGYITDRTGKYCLVTFIGFSSKFHRAEETARLLDLGKVI